MNLKGIAYAGAMTALLGLYTWIVGARALTLIQTGTPVGVGIGVGAGIIPLVTVWFLVKEWRQAQAVARMYRTLESEGGLVREDLPRSPAGRVDREAAAAAFPPYAEAVSRAPEDWRAWFHLGWAYDAAGDRKRARGALRRAAILFRRAR